MHPHPDEGHSFRHAIAALGEGGSPLGEVEEADGGTGLELPQDAANPPWRATLPPEGGVPGTRKKHRSRVLTVRLGTEHCDKHTKALRKRK